MTNQKQPKQTKKQALKVKIKHFFQTLPGLYLWFTMTILVAFIFAGASVMSTHSVILIYQGKEDLVYEAIGIVQETETDVIVYLTALTMGALFFAYAAILGHRDIKDIGADIRELEKKRKQEKENKD